jgi:hypothetical protein
MYSQQGQCRDSLRYNFISNFESFTYHYICTLASDCWQLCTLFHAKQPLLLFSIAHCCASTVSDTASHTVLLVACLHAILFMYDYQQLLQECFHPDKVLVTTNTDSDNDSDDEDNGPLNFLAIANSVNSRLTHSHKQQWHYVMQSLCLWLQVLKHMLAFYVAAEEDLLDNNNSYMLRNTGQGLQRVQSAPRVAKLMHDAIAVVTAAPYPVYGVYKGKLPVVSSISNTNSSSSYGSSYGSGSSSTSIRPFSVPYAKSTGNGYTPKRWNPQQQQQSRPFLGYNASKSPMQTQQLHQQQQQQHYQQQQQHAVRKHPWVGSTAVHLG